MIPRLAESPTEVLLFFQNPEQIPSDFGVEKLAMVFAWGRLCLPLGLSQHVPRSVSWLPQMI